MTLLDRDIAKKSASASFPDAQRMQLRYGFNEVDGWWSLSGGEHSKEIQRRLRLMGTKVVRVFVFDKPVPHPEKATEWDWFAGYINGVLSSGAVPMITFAKFHPPHDDPRALRTFLSRCEEIVWNCLEVWGGEKVRDWYWCIWNEPNNYQVGGDLNFSVYRDIYERTAAIIHGLLKPHLGGRKPLIGGPAACGFQPNWQDWITRLIGEVDDELISFVSWHHYGDWRPVVTSSSLGFDMKGSPEAPEGEAYRRLLMAQTPEYEARARAVSRIIAGRNIQNFCGELNTIVHHKSLFTGGLNQNEFGAAYYASALIHLIRGGAELEMRWSATMMDRDSYGLIDKDGTPTPAALAKQLFAQQIRYGDAIRFPQASAVDKNIDTIVAWSDDDRSGGVVVNTSSERKVMTIREWDPVFGRCSDVFKIDGTTAGKVARQGFDGTLQIEGYGVAIVTNRPDEVVFD